ncbi:helix-turn-helix domain-containing protein, partial [bacterium]|nr:helix-turn-helix domain-containing protein [bacterium]
MDQSESTNQSELLSAAEAAEYLGIKPPTLYAYVSRGLIESRAGSDARSRQYAREDLARLRARAGAPRGRR